MGNPNIGMIFPCWSPVLSIAEGSLPTYGTGRVLQEARTATINFQRSDGNPLIGDDHTVDDDNGCTGVTVDFENTGLMQDDRVAVLGEIAMTGNIYGVGGGNTPWGGFGFVRRMRPEGGKKFDAIIVLAIHFAENTQETRTREGQINWGVPTLHGVAKGLDIDGQDDPLYYIHQEFATAAAAKAWLREQLNVPAATST